MPLAETTGRALRHGWHETRFWRHLALKSGSLQPCFRKASTTSQAGTGATSGAPITKEAFLERCTLEHVPMRGFSSEALEATAEQLGLSLAWLAWVRRGPVELVEWWREHELRTTRTLLIEQDNWQLVDLAVQTTARQRPDQSDPVVWTRARLLAFMQTAFRLREPYRRLWPQALALQLQPNHTTRGLKLLTKTADEIAWFAGDRSTDMAWYQRRVAIAPLLQMSELYWIATLRDAPSRDDDQSDEMNSFHDAETWRFVERVLDDNSLVMRLWWPNRSHSSREPSEWLAMAQIMGESFAAWARAWTRGFL
ncbi:hypothetical protein CCYA_CCYA05G1603 [Cyanidiococcus yangmingshanensis]|nr:hypothetical protein CCYA_CCYA05G1603 [Cyanidiococcus yangmingshanensis]